MKISSLHTDPALESNGVWVDIGDGGKVKVARIDNPRYQERLRALGKPYRHQIRRGTLPVETQEELLYKVASETILLDWKGIEDEKGKEIKYSPEKAYEFLKEVKDFRDIVFELAENMETFRKLDEEEDAKNS